MTVRAYRRTVGCAKLIALPRPVQMDGTLWVEDRAQAESVLPNYWETTDDIWDSACLQCVELGAGLRQHFM
jgi:hypothetical protein